MFKLIRNVAFVVLLMYVWYVYCNKDEEETDKNEENSEEPSGIFIPTRNWKVVKKGQALPPGLHVRMNLETGVTEAKLVDDNDDSSKTSIKAVSEVQDHSPETLENSKVIKSSELKNIMKNIKGDDIIDPDNLKQITKKFRKYEELKNELEELNLTPKTDTEVLLGIMNELKDLNSHKQPRVLKLLEDLDFLVHQIDNAIEFSKHNGFKDIIYKNLNLTDVKIKSESLKLFSSLVQNNPKVKVEAIESGGLDILIRLVTLESNEDVKSRAVTALSCLLRRFPYAQQKFVENGGLSMISELFYSSNMKIKIKFATLISDLLLERQDLENSSLEKQYSQIDLNKLLIENKWCEKLNELLEIVIVTDSEGHDAIEKCLLAIKSIIKDCGQNFSRNIFLKLYDHYRHLALMEEGKEEEINNSLYFNEISLLCKEILMYLPNVYKKTEL